MRILIINTLPEGDDKAREAVEAIAAEVGDCTIVNTCGMKISHCIGCTACWLKTPGVCAIKDDYESILKQYLCHDAVIYVAGTALGFVDHRMKNVVDRILPLATMLTCFKDGQMRHVPRYDKPLRFALVYCGEADGEYLTRWIQRVAINMHGTSAGAFPADKAKEAALCISR